MIAWGSHRSLIDTKSSAVESWCCLGIWNGELGYKATMFPSRWAPKYDQSILLLRTFLDSLVQFSYFTGLPSSSNIWLHQQQWIGLQINTRNSKLPPTILKTTQALHSQAIPVPMPRVQVRHKGTTTSYILIYTAQIALKASPQYTTERIFGTIN